ncbi:MAG: hypothetical protein EBZ47_09890, partial [Chlamydiae bacterium]|nr:hypothetical protein [Chlamydiota bacterium]
NKEGGESGFVRKLIEKFEIRLKYAKEFDGIENVDLNKVPPEDHEAFLIVGDEEKYLNILMHSKEVPTVEEALYARRVKRAKNEKPKVEHVKPKDTWLRRFMNRFVNIEDTVKKHPTFGKIKRSGGKQDGREEIEEEIN